MKKKQRFFDISNMKYIEWQDGDIAKEYLKALLSKQVEEVEDAEMLVSRVLFSSWQDKKYWLDSPEGKDNVQSSETSGEGELR